MNSLRGGESGTVGPVTGRVLLAALLLAACSSSAPSTTATVPHTGQAGELAPSQLTSETVPPPDLPPRCDPDDVSATVVDAGGAGEDGGGDGGGDLGPDQIIDLTNDGALECDVDISATAGTAPEMEPSVRLAPGGVGHVWLEVQDDCDESLADPQTELRLDVNGVQRVVDLVVVAPCGVQLVAFFTP